MNYENEMEISFRSVPVNEMLARNAVAAFILYLDPEVEELAEIKTAVSEAVTNCIVHGYEENPKGIITLECKISYDRKLYIKVADKGRGIENIEQARRPEILKKGQVWALRLWKALWTALMLFHSPVRGQKLL